MDILIPYNWLKDFLTTAAKPEEIAEKLSLCGFSVEKIISEGDDVIFQIEGTSNRPDALSVLGIARELGAILPQFDLAAEFNDNAEELKIKAPTHPLELKINIENPKLCPRFTALILDKIEVKPSPEMIQQRLNAVGIRALNNVIDITNYLMIERGQPMHVFDYDKIAGAEMNLRESRAGEKLVTLDGQEKILPPGTIVIQDAEKLIDLCGIMGGENSGVSEQTKRVVLFVQIYDPMRIRKTTQALAFRTEAAARFEKGMDLLGVVPALKQAAHFLITEAGGHIASDLIDIENKAYVENEVTVTLERIERILGVKMEPERISRILKPLGFEAHWVTAANDITSVPELKVKVPSWRTADVKIAEDIVEEIARIYGYHQIPTHLPPLPNELGTEEQTFAWERRVRELLAGWGFYEVQNYSLTNRDRLTQAGFDPEAALTIKNPLTAEMTHLRTSLVPQLLENIAQNQNHAEKIKLFELNPIYLTEAGAIPPKQPLRLTGVIYQKLPTENLFYQAKGVVEALLGELDIAKFQFRLSEESTGGAWQDQRTAKVVADEAETDLGDIGEIKAEVRTRFGITGQIAAFDLDFEKIAELATHARTYQPLPNFPPIVEELTFEIGEVVPAGEVARRIENPSRRVKDEAGRGSRIEGVKIEAQIKGVYQDEVLKQAGKRAVTYLINYQAQDRGLTTEEVKPLREAIVTSVAKEFQGKLRGTV